MKVSGCLAFSDLGCLDMMKNMIDHHQGTNLKEIEGKIKTRNFGERTRVYLKFLKNLILKLKNPKN